MTTKPSVLGEENRTNRQLLKLIHRNCHVGGFPLKMEDWNSDLETTIEVHSIASFETLGTFIGVFGFYQHCGGCFPLEVGMCGDGDGNLVHSFVGDSGYRSLTTTVIKNYSYFEFVNMLRRVMEHGQGCFPQRVGARLEGPGSINQMDWTAFKGRVTFDCRTRGFSGTIPGELIEYGVLTHQCELPIEGWEQEFNSYDSFGDFTDVFRSSLDLPINEAGLETVKNYFTNQIGFKVLEHLSERAVTIVEDVTLLFSTLYDLTLIPGVPWTTYAKVLYMSFRSITEVSLCKLLVEYFSELFLGEPEQQAGDDLPNWIKCIKDIRFHWKRAIDNAAFRKVSKLIGVSMGLGLVSKDYQGVEFAGVKLFGECASKSTASATNLVDAAMDTIDFFATGGYKAITTGDLSPLLYDSSRQASAEQEYVILTTAMGAMINGNYDVTGMSEQEFCVRVDKLIGDLDLLEKTMRSNGAAVVSIKQKNATIKKLRMEYREKMKKGGFREAPFTYVVFGESGVGKSTCTDILGSYILRSNNIECEDANTYCYNMQDKYDSGYHSGVVWVKFDDFNNTKSDFTQESPAYHLIRFCNNVQQTATMADLEGKGKIVLKPKIVSLTTNTPDLGARTYSNEPGSIVRRPNFHVRVSVLPEFQRSGSHMVDTEKVQAKFGSDPGVAQAIWKLDLYEASLDSPIDYDDDINAIQRRKPVNFVFKYIQYKGKDMKGVDLATALKCVKDLSRKHYLEQSSLVENMKEPVKKMRICTTCALPKGVCSCENAIFLDQDGEKGLRNESNSVELGDIIKDTFSCVWSPLKRLVFNNSIICKLRYILSGPRVGVREQESYSEWLRSADSHLNALSSTQGFYTRLWDETLGCFLFPWPAFWGVNTITRSLCLTAAEACQDISRTLKEYIIVDLKKDVFERMNRFDKFVYTSLPESFMHLNCVKSLRMRIVQKTLKRDLEAHFKRSIFFRRLIVGGYCAFPVLFFRTMNWTVFKGLSTFVGASLVLSVVTDSVVKLTAAQAVVEELERARCSIEESVKLARAEHVKYVIGTFFVAGTAYTAYTLHKRYKKMSKVDQAGQYFLPSLDATPAEVIKADTSGSDKFWLGELQKRHPKPVGKWNDCPQLMNVIKMNLVRVEAWKEAPGILYGTKSSFITSNGLFVVSNRLVVPAHFAKHIKVGSKVTVKRFPLGDDGKAVRGNSMFEFFFDWSCAATLENTDVCMIHVPNSGDFTDIIEAFPVEHRVHGVPFRMITKEEDCSVTMRTGRLGPLRARVVEVGNVFAFEQEYDKKTTKGDCMSVAIEDDKRPTICGVHNFGYPSETDRRGGLESVLQKTVFKLHELLNEKVPLCFPVGSGEFPEHQYGERLVHFEEPPFNSPLHHIEQGNYRYIGSCKNNSRASSAVIPSHISAQVEAICGVPRKWGPPKFHGPKKEGKWHPYQANLLKTTNCNIGFEPSRVKVASEDYSRELMSRLNDFWKAEVAVLDDSAIINGIPGVKFIDGITMSSSPGYPLSGPKSAICEQTPTGAWVAPDYIWEHFHIMIETYKDGKRCYTIFKGCLKDEATKWTKDSVRVFSAAMFAFGMLVRKYFLPVARFISNNMATSECAVGLNVHSPQWDMLYEHLTKHGVNRVIAIDYSAYDTTMSAQLISAAFRILIDIAAECGYEEEDLKVMHGIAMDIANPTVAIYGNIVLLIGSNPSGHNLTVYINSIVNSLLFRMAYLDKNEGRFADANALMTYGDDAVCCVVKGCDFDAIQFSQFMEKYGMKVTNSSKEKITQKFQSIEEIDFLKRKFRFDEDLQRMVAPIDEDSIFKSLHCARRSAEHNPANLASDAIDCALGEWMFFGRDVYEKRRKEMLCIAEELGMVHLCRTISWDYETRLNALAMRYMEELPFPEQVTPPDLSGVDDKSTVENRQDVMVTTPLDNNRSCDGGLHSEVPVVGLELPLQD